MPAINATNLRALRDRKGWSLDELARRSAVDRGTISRIETGKQVGNRLTTKERLAKALEVSIEKLTGPDIPSADREFDGSAKSQFTFRMENSARNALALVSSLYGVKPAHVLHLAPLLFLWAAEESLRQRQNGLDELMAELNAVKRPAELAHLDGCVESNWRGEDVLEGERRSIAKGDLFGMELDYDALKPDYDEYEENPMAQFLRRLAATLNKPSQFQFWYPASEPHYWLCEDEASTMVGGDEQATSSILEGYAPLHELPRTVAEAGPAEVAAWAIARRDEVWSELFGPLDLKIDLGGNDGQ